MQSPDRILIADDEPDIALILKLHLEEVGYPTDWAHDGQSCLAMLEKDNFSLLLLDVRMPLLNGMKVLESIRQSGNDVAIIMMTAHGSEDLAVECMRNGALDYFAKPFDLNDVLVRVERALANRRTMLAKRRLEQEKDDFVSMLSHDLKNPITAVIGAIDIMREGRLGPVNDEQADYLQSAIDSCNEVVAMIDNLLDVQRFESNMMRMIIGNHAPADIITAAAASFVRVARHEGITLAVDMEEKLPDIAVDKRAFTRVIANLLGNAFKFTPNGGKIIITCRSIAASQVQIPRHCTIPAGFPQFQTQVQLTIRDTGGGIPAEDLSRIFERFVQSRHNGGERNGAGLGLAFCKLAVESFGGLIWAESEIGVGSEFFILLPVKN